jgi:hypothetical protein
MGLSAGFGVLGVRSGDMGDLDVPMLDRADDLKPQTSGFPYRTRESIPHASVHQWQYLHLCKTPKKRSGPVID